MLIVFGGSFLYAIIAYVIIYTTISSPITQTIRLEQVYALTALSLLYTILITKPLQVFFPENVLVKQLAAVRKYLTLSVIFFAVIHASLAFFGQLGGFNGLFFLSSTYLIAIGLSFTGLLLLLPVVFLLYYKHPLPSYLLIVSDRLLSGIGLLILIHALMLGSHFIDLMKFIPQIFTVLIAVYVLLEALRIDRWLRSILRIPVTVGPVFSIALIGMCWYGFLMFQSSGSLALGIHASHLDAMMNDDSTVNENSKRYTVDFDYPSKIEPGKEIPLTFTVYDANTGDVVTEYSVVYEKLMHVIIVDEKLSYFSHIHPEFIDGRFVVSAIFPSDGRYRVYTDFQPLNGPEEMMAFSLSVGTGVSDASDSEVDTSVSRTVGSYTVTIAYPRPLTARDLSEGMTEVTFTVTDRNGNAVSTLKPYLGSYGHMVMINQKTYEYLHVHPAKSIDPNGDDGGPTIAFYPFNIYGSVTPGVYRVFIQVNPNGQLITADFTINVE